MSLFLAFLAILPALYAILPRSKQLSLRLRLSWFDWVVMTSTVVILLGFEFHDFLVSHSRWFWHKLPRGITSSNLSTLIIVGLVVFVGLRLRFSRLRPSKFDEFTLLAEELLWSGSHAELIALINEHQAELVKILRSETLAARINQRLTRMTSFAMYSEAFAALKNKSFALAPPENSSWFERVLKKFPRTSLVKVREVFRYLTRWDRHEDFREELVRAVLLNDAFADAIVRLRPYLGLNILEKWGTSRDAMTFLDRYMNAVLSLRDSVFYRELSDNQNMDGTRYHIASTNRLLRFFLADAKVAIMYGIYKPVGDYVVNLLDQLNWDSKIDPYNRAMTNFEAESKRGDPIYATKQFFEIMVLEALHQDTDWHMWLYYLDTMVEKMCRNAQFIDPLSKKDQEFPTRYHYLIYEVVTSLCDFIGVGEDLSGHENIKLFTAVRLTSRLPVATDCLLEG
jgi:hypothetical protein